MITKLELSKMIDHSLLKPTVTKEDTIKGIEIGMKYDVAAVTIKPCWVRLAAEMCKGSDVLVDPVICFPFGYDTTETKVFATQQAIEDGADEIDMVMNLGMFFSGEYDYVQADMKVVVDAAQGAPVKVIFETAYFLMDDAALIMACQMAEEAGVAFVKTSTGFAPAGYTFHQLKVMRDAVSEKVEVKAAQGVRSLEDALAVRELGITRFGATRTVDIMKQWEERFG